MRSKEVVIFDTNGLNNLLDDEGQEDLLGCFENRFGVMISEINVIEVAATGDAVRRGKLLDLLQRLVPLGGCLLPPYQIAAEMARCHARYKDRFEWADVDVKCPDLDQEIATRSLVSTTAIADESRLWARSTDKEFKAIFRDAVETFPLDTSSTCRPSQEEIINILKAGGGPFWLHVSSLYENCNLIPLPANEAESFVQKCPPFHVLAIISCIGQYNALPMAPGEQRPPAAGRADLLMATYLPYCDLFISDDPGVRKDLQVVVRELKLTVEILTYQGLKARCLSPV